MHDDAPQLDPESLRQIAEGWSCLDEGDVLAARRALTRLETTVAESPEALELIAEVALAEDDPAAALDAYSRWSAADPADPEPWIASAEVYLEYYEEAGEAARLLRELLAGPELDPVDEADARHLLGLACEAKKDRRGMVKEWLAVLRLDAINDGPDPLLAQSQFEAIAERALDELPDEILAHLRNVPILVEDRPSESLILEGLDPRTLGLFHGIAMPHRSTLGGGPETGLIHLFHRNLERETLSEDDLAEQIRVTVIHETAHYFGASEDDLRQFGLN